MEPAALVSASPTARILGKLKATRPTEAVRHKVSVAPTGLLPTLARRPAQTARIVHPGPVLERLQTPEARAQLATPIARPTREAMALPSLRSDPRLPMIEALPLLVRIRRLAAPTRHPAAAIRHRAATIPHPAARTQLLRLAEVIPHRAVPTQLRLRPAIILLPAAATRRRAGPTQLRPRAAVILLPAALTRLPLLAAVLAEVAAAVLMAEVAAGLRTAAAAADPRTVEVAAVVGPIDNSFRMIRKGPPLFVQAGLFIAALQIPCNCRPQLSTLARV